MSKIVDMAGLKCGRLLVIKQNGRNIYQSVMWECLCDCGTYVTVEGPRLRKGSTRSCGCLHDENAGLNGKRNKTHGHTTIGGSRTWTTEYSTWRTMKARCYNPRATSYELYGGRGIGVSDRWLHSFENFLLDLGNKPKGLTLERKDNYKDYGPDNCIWATRADQNRNKRHHQDKRERETKCNLAQKV